MSSSTNGKASWVLSSDPDGAAVEAMRMERRVKNWLHFLVPALIVGVYSALSNGNFVGGFVVGLLLGAVWSLVRGFFKMLGYLDGRIKVH